MKTLDKTIRNLNLKFVVPHPLLERQLNTDIEPEVLDLIDTLNLNDCLIDLGAAEGRFATYAAKKGIETWAIEPDIHNFTTLAANKELNQLNNLHILQTAIGSKDGIARLKVGQPYPGGHQKIIESCSGRNDLLFHFSEVQEVTLISYDSLIKTYKITPTVLKIDIDGSELDFFKGTTNLSGVSQLMIELCTNDPNYSDIINRLETHGFRFKAHYPIPEEKNLFNIWFIRNPSKII